MRGVRGAGRVLSVVAGTIGGLIASAIVVLNLHILVGLEHGYAAGPREVWRASTVLAVIDVALLAVGPLAGAITATRWSSPVAHRRRHRGTRAST